tara:strand:+ start:193 stop:660 length:468 start_codon:yes stop_codon:yes gene_type:complete
VPIIKDFKLYKKTSKYQSGKGLRKILAENLYSKGASCGKRSISLPDYMYEDYQKVKTTMTPHEFIREAYVPIKKLIPYDLLRQGNKKYNLFEEFPFGKFKGKPVKGFGKQYGNMNYICWFLYTMSKTSARNTKLFRSLYFHSETIRAYLHHHWEM